MAIEDLDLEFEEEGEKSSGVIEIDEELSFNAVSANAERGRAQPKVEPAKAGRVAQKPVQAAKPKVSDSDRTNPNLVIPKNLNAPSGIEPSFNNPISNDDKVKDLGAERQKRSASHPQMRGQKSAPQSAPQSAATEEVFDLNYASLDEVQYLREEVEKLRQEMGEVKVEAEVRARVAEERSKFVIEYLTEAKMMNHQMTQILQRIGGRVPGLKNEVLMAKKIIDEFLKKSSK